MTKEAQNQPCPECGGSCTIVCGGEVCCGNAEWECGGRGCTGPTDGRYLEQCPSCAGKGWIEFPATASAGATRMSDRPILMKAPEVRALLDEVQP